MSTAPYAAASYPNAQAATQPTAPTAQPTGKTSPSPWPMPESQQPQPVAPTHATQPPLADLMTQPMTPCPGTTPVKPVAQAGLMYPPGTASTPTPAAAPGTPLTPGSFAPAQPTTTANFASGASVSPSAYNPSMGAAAGMPAGQQIVTLDATAQQQAIPTVQVLPTNGKLTTQVVQQPISPEMMAELNRRALQMVAAGGFKDLSSRVQELPAARVQGIDEALTRVLALKEKVNELQKKRVHYHGHISANAGVAAASAIFTAGTSLIVQGAGGLHQYNRLRQIVRSMKECLDQINQLRAEFDAAPGWEVLEGQVRIVEKVFSGSGIDRKHLHGSL